MRYWFVLVRESRVSPSIFGAIFDVQSHPQDHLLFVAERATCKTDFITTMIYVWPGPT